MSQILKKIQTAKTSELKSARVDELPEVDQKSDSQPSILFVSDSKFNSKKLRGNLIVYKNITEFTFDVFRGKRPADFNHLKYVFIDLTNDENRAYLERYLKQFKDDGWFIFAIPRKINCKWVSDIKPHVCIHKKKIGEIQAIDLNEMINKMQDFLNVTKINFSSGSLFKCGSKKNTI